MNTRNDLYENGNDTLSKPSRAFVAPAVDVYENRDELLVVADVPGATKESIAVNVDANQLTLEARRGDAPKGTALGGERILHDYRRVFTLPQGIDASKIEAELESGVLRVKLPKSEVLKPRRITVKGS